MDENELAKRLTQYSFYHIIPLTPTLKTTGDERHVSGQQKVLRALRGVDFKGKRVLDVGCRDGLYSFDRVVLVCRRRIDPEPAEKESFRSVYWKSLHRIQWRTRRFGAPSLVQWHLRVPVLMDDRSSGKRATSRVAARPRVGRPAYRVGATLMKPL